MGRNVTNTTTTKAIITNDVPSTFATVYNNTTGAAAELLGININGTGDDTNFITGTTFGDDWDFFGNHTIPVHAYAPSTTTYGFGVPYPVQLSDDRILTFFLPHWQHWGGGNDFMGGNTVHTQILEYNDNRFRSSPISTHTLPTASFNAVTYSLWTGPNQITGSFKPPLWRAVALSPTKVVAAYRVGNVFRLLRFTITGNVVDTVIQDLDLTTAAYFNTTFNGAFSLSAVPGNTNQVIVGGYATTNWSIQAISVPDSGAMSNLTPLTSTTIAVSPYHFGMSQMVKTPTANVTPYIIAGATAATTGQSVIFSYNSDTNTFTRPGSVVTLTAAVGAWSGMQCECLSTGTSPDAVIAATQTSSPQTMSFYRQISATQALNALTTFTLQHTTARALTESYRWGDERAVFTGSHQTLVVYDSTGTITNLLDATETVNTTQNIQQWYPFNSKPLYNAYDGGTTNPDRVCQYVSRKNVESTTDVGDVDVRGCYLPMGHDRGMCYAWNEPAQCWIIGYHGRIYALDTTGHILSEVSLYELSNLFTYDFRIADLAVTPSGRILFSTVRYFGSIPSTAYLSQSNWSAGANPYAAVTDPVTNGANLGKTKLQQVPFNTAIAITCSLTAFSEVTSSGLVERAYLFGMDAAATPQGRIVNFDGTNWTATGSSATAIPSTSQTTQHTGWHPNFKLVQDTPCSLAYPSGLWRIVGSYGMNSTTNYYRVGVSLPYAPAQFTSLNPQSIQVSNVTDIGGYGINLYKHDSGSRAGITVATQYAEQDSKVHVWTSIDGKLNFVKGWTSSVSQFDNRFAQAAVSKFAYAVAMQNTSKAISTSDIYVFNKNDINTPEETLTTTSGHGWVQLYRTDKNAFFVYGPGVDESYIVAGIPDTVKFYVLLNDGSTNDFYLNNGQVLDIASSATGLYRASDVYVIPAGYNIKIRSDTPYTITTLLSIKEYI